MLRTIVAVTLCAAGALGGCASMQAAEARHAEDLMAASGFRHISADTPERVNALQTLQPRTFTIVEREGTKYWVYADPANCQCLYAGTEEQYQQYKRFVVQEGIAQDQRAAAEASSYSSDWGMWGPWR